MMASLTGNSGMFWTTLIAHGVFGPYDEIIVPLIALVFLALIGITWLRSRNTFVAPPPPETPDKTKPESDDSHFTLD
jgi:hypothetical protein